MNGVRRLAFLLAVIGLVGGAYLIARGVGSSESKPAAPAPVDGNAKAPSSPSRADAPPPLAGAPKSPAKPSPSEAPSRAGDRVLAGTLLAPGKAKPVAGARVRAVPQSGEPSPWVATDAKGAFRIEGLAPGSYRLIARTSPTGPELPILDGVEAMDPSVAPIAAELPPVGAPAPSVAHRVRVLGPDGAPVPQAHALLWLDGRFGGFLDVKDGWFDRTMGETFGTYYEVFAAKDAKGEALPFGPGRVAAEDAGDAETTELRLLAERTISGRIIDAAGGPLPGLEVSAFPVPVTVPGPAGEIARSLAHALPNAHGKAKTDAEGGFVLGGLGDGRYRVAVNVGPLRASPPIPEVASGTTDLVLRTPLAVEARITVLDPGGQPVAGATVTAARPGIRSGSPGPGLDPQGGRTSVTNAHGVALLVGLDGESTYVFTVSPPAARGDLRFALGPKDWKPHDDTITLPLDHLVRGVVHDAAGNPKRGVVLRRLADGTWKPAGGALADGHFTVRLLDPGTATFAAANDFQGARGPEVTATVDGEPIVLVLPP